MPNTLHAYKHVQGIYLPIAVGVFVLVVGTLLVLLVCGARRTVPGGAHRRLRWRQSMRCAAGVRGGVSVVGHVHRGDADRPHGRAPGAADLR